MTAEERQHILSQHIANVEFASLEELAKLVGVSVSTVRRDLNYLETQGGLRRTHGGVRTVNPASDEFTFSTRDTHQLAEKQAIGKLLARHIGPRQTVIMDAGTTVFHVANELQEKDLQIITNSLPVANLFASAQRTEVVVTGGVIYPRLGVLVGPLAVKAFSELHADVAVMGAGGITLDGLTNSHALLIDIQRAMIRSARKVFVCLDHTKFDRRSVAFLCDLEAVQLIVTDWKAPRPLVDSLRAKGIEVLMATPDATEESGTTDAGSTPAQPIEAGGKRETALEQGVTQGAANPDADGPFSMVSWD